MTCEVLESFSFLVDPAASRGCSGPFKSPRGLLFPRSDCSLGSIPAGFRFSQPASDVFIRVSGFASDSLGYRSVAPSIHVPPIGRCPIGAREFSSSCGLFMLVTLLFLNYGAGTALRNHPRLSRERYQSTPRRRLIAFFRAPNKDRHSSISPPPPSSEKSIFF